MPFTLISRPLETFLPASLIEAMLSPRVRAPSPQRTPRPGRPQLAYLILVETGLEGGLILLYE